MINVSDEFRGQIYNIPKLSRYVITKTGIIRLLELRFYQ